MTDTTTNQTADDTPPPQPITLHGPGDIVELVPYLLGFHPTESLVLVGITDGTVAVTARVELAEVNRTTMSDLLDTLARRGRCTQAIAVSYTDDRCAADGLAAVIDAAAHAADVSVLDHLLVTAGRWMSLACTDPGCCPPEGTPLHEAGHAAGPVAAAAVYAGLVAEPSRDAALACLDVPPAGSCDAVAAFLAAAEQEVTQTLLTGSIERYRRSIIRTCYRAARTGEPLTDEAVARVLVALWTYSVRDPLWLATDQGRLAGQACTSRCCETC